MKEPTWLRTVLCGVCSSTYGTTQYALLEVHARNEENISEHCIYSCCLNVLLHMHKTLHTSYSALLLVHYVVLSLLCIR